MTTRRQSAKAVQRKVSKHALEQDLIDKLRKKGAKRGLGYQPMLKVIVREHVDEY